MNTRLVIVSLIILTACSSKSIDNTQTNSLEIKDINQEFDTLKINDQQYFQIVEDNRFNCLLSIQGDTIVKSEGYYSEVKFLDIDKDGYKDIRVFIFSNTPNQCDNYLYDQELKTFKILENCNLDIEKLEGTQFYYSYNRVGCAEMNWESHLSKIESHKLVNYCYMNGQGCEVEIKENPQVIKIYKIIDSIKNEMKLIKTLSYMKCIPKSVNKWDFIKKFWTLNIKTFNL